MSEGLSPENELSEAIPPSSFIERWAIGILFLALFLISFSPFFTRLSEVGPISTGAGRAALSLPLMFAMFWRDKKDRAYLVTPAARKDVLLLILAGVIFAGNLVFWNLSVMMTSVANSVVISNMAPVFVALVSWLFFKERFTRTFLGSLALAIFGVMLMMSDSFQASPQALAGDALALVNACFFAGYFITVARVRQRVSAASVMFVGGLASSLITVTIAYIFEPQVWPHTARGWAVMAGMVLVVHVGGQTLLAMSLRYVSASLSSMMMLLQPILPALMAWIAFGEKLVWQQIAGTALTFVGIAIAQRSQATKSS